MKCDKCSAKLEPIFRYKFPNDPKKVHLYICTQCLTFLQQYTQDDELSYQMWGTFTQ